MYDLTSLLCVSRSGDNISRSLHRTWKEASTRREETVRPKHIIYIRVYIHTYILDMLNTIMLIFRSYRHMVIEGASEMSVRQARMEIQRALDEETIRIGTGKHIYTYTLASYILLAYIENIILFVFRCFGFIWHRSGGFSRFTHTYIVHT